MGEPRISVILIGLLLMSLVIAGLTGFIGSGAVKYNANTFNESTLNKFSDVAYDVEDITSDTESNLSGVSASKDSNFDIFGGFFSKSWSALKTLGRSIGVFFNIIDNGTEELPLDNDYSTLLKVVLLSMVLIIIVIAILSHYIKPTSRL